MFFPQCYSRVPNSEKKIFRLYSQIAIKIHSQLSAQHSASQFYFFSTAHDYGHKLKHLFLPASRYDKVFGSLMMNWWFADGFGKGQVDDERESFRIILPIHITRRKARRWLHHPKKEDDYETLFF